MSAPVRASHEPSWRSGVRQARNDREDGRTFPSAAAAVAYARELAAECGQAVDDFACGYANERDGWRA